MSKYHKSINRESRMITHKRKKISEINATSNRDDLRIKDLYKDLMLAFDKKILGWIDSKIPPEKIFEIAMSTIMSFTANAVAKILQSMVTESMHGMILNDFCHRLELNIKETMYANEKEMRKHDSQRQNCND